MSSKSDRVTRLHDRQRPAPLGLVGQPALWAILLGALFLLLGLVRGEPYQVWLRAVQICLGCIGIG